MLPIYKIAMESIYIILYNDIEHQPIHLRTQGGVDIDTLTGGRTTCRNRKKAEKWEKGGE